MSQAPPPASQEWAATLDFRVLGPLVVTDGDGVPLELGPRKQRAVLAVLLLNAGRVVSLDRMIDALWADEAPSRATGTLQAYISQLRRILEPHRSPRAAPRLLLTREPGYLLAARPAQVDTVRFTAQVEAARAAAATGDHAAALTRLTEALNLWRGEPFQEFADEEFAAAEAARLEEARAAATEDLLDALLALGRNAEAVTAARRLLDRHRFRERAWAQLMLAFYRDGRQADALAAYHRARDVLDEELGLLPGPELQRLESAILRHDPALMPAAPATPASIASPRAPTVPSVPADEPEGKPDSAGADRDLVGRKTQLDWILERGRAATAAKGGLLLIAGSAGVGKSTLVEAATERAAERGITCVWSRCVEGGATPAFWPWIQILRALPERHGGAAVTDMLTGRVEPPWHRDDPETARFHLHESVLAALRAASAEEPLLLVVEDIHVADAASLRLLRHVAGELRRLPILLLATTRSEPGEFDPELRGTFSALVDEPGVERADVQPFGLAEIQEYLRDHPPSGSAAEPDEAMARALHERTGGNPFYLKELLRLLSSEHPGGWGTRQAVAENAVPESVRDIIGRRVARMPADTQSLLRAAAVIGRDVDLALLEETAGIDDERVMSLLEPAVAAGLLVESPRGWDYRFEHALVRDALYAELSRLQRARIHLRVGEALETLRGTDDPAALGLLAHHFGMAARIGASAKAVGYARAAAMRARSQLAYEAAVAFLELALTALDPADAKAPAERCALLIELGRARRVAGDYVGARQSVDEAVTLALRLGDDALMMDAATVYGGISFWNWKPHDYADTRTISILEDLLTRLDPDDRRSRAILLGTLGVELYYSDRREDGVRYAAEAVEIARQTGDPELRARTLNNYCLAAWEPPRHGSLLAALNEMLELGSLAPQVELTALMHRTLLLMAAGDLEAYDADLARCRHLVTRTRATDVMIQFTVINVGRVFRDGHWAEGERLLDGAFDQFKNMNIWGVQWTRLSLLYTVRRFQDRPGDLLEELVARADEPGLELLRPTAMIAACESGDEALAHRLLDRWGVQIFVDWNWYFSAFQWGLLSAYLGRPDPARMYDALAPYADRLMSVGATTASWGCFHHVLAALAHRLGRTEAAREHARAALALHRRLGLRHLIEESLRQLETLGAEPSEQGEHTG